MILELNRKVEVEETAELLQYGIYIQKHNKREKEQRQQNKDYRKT